MNTPTPADTAPARFSTTAPTPPAGPLPLPTRPLALFDLDHTLLAGDSDVLWVEFMHAQGQLSDEQLAQSATMAAGYREGTVDVTHFCRFYASLLAGHDAAHWLPWRQRFLHEAVRPLIPPAARELVERHRAAGDCLVLTTATNRVLSALTGQDLGFDQVIATELELRDGRYTGNTADTLNMRAGKLTRLHAWLSQRGWPARLLAEASFYSDSINDLPLLEAVAHPIAVDPDPRLRSLAEQRGWRVMSLLGG